MFESLEMSVYLPVAPERVYIAWLDAVEHAAFTGSPALIDPQPGGAFRAWDGYITGRTLELDPPRRILQAWRTTEFAPGDPDSLLELLLDPTPRGCRMTLRHTNLPPGSSAMYAQGWEDYYFALMKEYFA